MARRTICAARVGVNTTGFMEVRMSIAVVAGASGGVGGALVQALRERSAFDEVVALSRTGEPAFDIADEASVAAAAQALAGRDVRLVIDATGFLHGGAFPAGKEPAPARSRAHAPFLRGERDGAGADDEALPADGAARGALRVRHALGAVGSISDNRLGGWHSYRASKAALNQFMRTAAVELARTRPNAICVSLHPGTVDTRMSQAFSKAASTCARRKWRRPICCA